MENRTAQSSSLSPSIWRVSAYRFFALLTLPAIALIVLIFIDIFMNLNQIQKITDALSQAHLPGILDSQRTLTNLETLRRNAETVYTAEDSRERRAARLNAQALAAESAFETAPHFADFAITARQIINELDQAKERSEQAADALHNSELRLSGVIRVLVYAFKRPVGLSLTHKSKHPTSSPRDTDPARQQLAEQEILLLRAECSRVRNDERLRKVCGEMDREWRKVTEAWQQRIKADLEARIIWGRLDSLLLKLSDATSTAEVKRAYAAMERIREEARRTRLAFYISSLLLLTIVIGFTILMHRYFLGPVALAAQTLQRIRFGRPTAPLPPVRIRELQALLDLLPSLSEYLSELNTRSGRLEQEKNEYASLSLSDALTGIGNRRAFDLRLAGEAQDKPLALLMLDVDMFKAYNDTLGHQAGDVCLQAVAKAAEKALLRSEDRIFRYGGEEFTVLLPEVREASAMQVALRIMRAINDLQLPHPASSVAPHVTISIGVAGRDESMPLSDAELVAHADKALYRAKHSGRNSARVYDEREEKNPVCDCHGDKDRPGEENS